MTTDTIPGQVDIDGTVDTPPEPPKPDAAPKPARAKPTTRAERAARAEATKRERAQKAAAKGDKRPAQTSSRKAPLGSRLNGAFVGVGTSITLAGAMVGSEPLKADGAVITANAGPLGDAFDKLAAGDPRVKDALEKMLTAGAYSGLFVAIMPVALAIMSNHGMLPPEVATMMGAGTIPPPAPGESGPLPDTAFGAPAPPVA